MVTFTEMKEELLKDPEVKKEYDALKDEDLPSTLKLYDVVILGCHGITNQRLAYEWISDPANKTELMNPYVDKALLFYDDVPVDDALGYGIEGHYYVNVVSVLGQEGTIHEFETKKQVDHYIRRHKYGRAQTVKHAIDTFLEFACPEGSSGLRVIPIVKDGEVVYTITYNERVIKDEALYSDMRNTNFADDIFEIVDTIGENVDGYTIIALYWVEDNVVECTLMKDGRKSAPIGIAVDSVRHDLFRNIQLAVKAGPKYLERWFDKE